MITDERLVELAQAAKVEAAAAFASEVVRRRTPPDEGWILAQAIKTMAGLLTELPPSLTKEQVGILICTLISGFLSTFKTTIEHLQQTGALFAAIAEVRDRARAAEN